MTREQADKITQVFNANEMIIDFEPLAEIVKEQIKADGFCSPILQPIAKALWRDEVDKTNAAHQVRSVWRLARWDYMYFSQLWCKEK